DLCLLIGPFRRRCCLAPLPAGHPGEDNRRSQRSEQPISPLPELPVGFLLLIQPQLGLVLLVAPGLFLAFPRFAELLLPLLLLGHAAFLGLAAGFKEVRLVLLQGSHPWK